MNTLAIPPFQTKFTDIIQWLEYPSKQQAFSDLQTAQLIQSQDYEVIDGEVMLSRNGLRKLVLVCTTPKAQAIKSQFENTELPLLEGDAPIEVNPISTAPIPSIKWIVHGRMAWGKYEDHFFTVHIDGKSSFFYNIPDWSFPNDLLTDNQLKPEIVNHGIQLINQANSTSSRHNNPFSSNF